MGLRLIDSARIVRSVDAGQKVEGRSPFVAVTGASFPCRIVTDPVREAEAAGRRRATATATLICRESDLRLADEIQVEAKVSGSGRWRVAGTPQIGPARWGGRVTTVVLERLTEPQAPEVAA